MIYPNEYLDSVKEIKIELLQKNQIKGIILDVDNTLIDFHKKYARWNSGMGKRLKRTRN